MKSLRGFLAVFLVILGIVAAAPIVAHAGMKSQTAMMGDMKEDSKAQTAISGFCPVCVIHGMAMKGSNNFVTEYKGKVYKFAGFNEQKMFIENPEEYITDLEIKFQQLNK